MTSFRYNFARLIGAFGIKKQNKRIAAIAAETHLLHDAEEVIGHLCWKNAEHIDAITAEYWTLRELTVKRKEVQERIHAAEEILMGAQQNRAEILNIVSEKGQDLILKRDNLIHETEALAAQRERCINEAQIVKRRYEGLQTKLKVLRAEGLSDKEDELKALQNLNEIKQQFGALKTERLEVAAQIEANDEKLIKLDETIEIEQSTIRKEANSTFTSIGEANRAISNQRAELGNIDVKMAQIQSVIGSHISRNYLNDSNCAQALRPAGKLTNQVAALRDSIEFNKKLADYI